MTRLLHELQASPSEYRIRIGVAAAIYERSQPLVLTDARQAAALVHLVEDDDVLVRKYASEALMRLTDPREDLRVQLGRAKNRSKTLALIDELLKAAPSRKVAAQLQPPAQ